MTVMPSVGLLDDAATTGDGWRPSNVYALPAHQQPLWSDQSARRRALRALGVAEALVTWPEVERLRLELAAAGRGELLVLQAGDCSESFRDGPAESLRKAEVLGRLADELAATTGRSVIRIGRIAGQYAKPRSAPVDGGGPTHLPSFRGHIINGDESTLHARQHDADRLLWGYQHASNTLRALRDADQVGVGAGVRAPMWISHEALTLDYEIPLTRPLDAPGGWLLTSTHLPWIGLRTNQPGGALVDLCAHLANPVGCKINSDTSVVTTLELCRRLNPARQPGRLVLVSRMGASVIHRALPPLLCAVADAGYPVTWLCDPMHANTVSTRRQVKTRRLDDIVAEIDGFLRAHERAGTVAGGIHLELAARSVTECLGLPGPEREEQLGVAYTSLCDPRLNPAQASAVLQRVRW
jgi:3-deoxy-7-phosphoheptulonate synthase